ncbi:apolipoprotein D [Microplitis demolitor]|uniref:apolipoprotein D n=1 Tax=Microplitis demolitor TaxID=69319 RepID=UPI0004CDD7AB|nr:apolipoprotein D [Microplitis demolitor]
MLRLTIIFCLIVGAFSQSSFRDNSCPVVNLRGPFDLSRCLGDWYVHQRSSIDRPVKEKCLKKTWFEYDGDLYAIFSSTSTKTNHTLTIEGKAYVNNDKTVSLIYELPIVGNYLKRYWVLDIDYDSYAIVWSCLNGIETVWVFSREQIPRRDINYLTRRAMAKYNLRLPYLVTIDNQNCSQSCYQ